MVERQPEDIDNSAGGADPQGVAQNQQLHPDMYFDPYAEQVWLPENVASLHTQQQIQDYCQAWANTQPKAEIDFGSLFPSHAVQLKDDEAEGQINDFESNFTKEDRADIQARLEVFDKLTADFSCELGKVSH